jgi:hypothetical protein
MSTIRYRPGALDSYVDYFWAVAAVASVVGPLQKEMQRRYTALLQK